MPESGLIEIVPDFGFVSVRSSEVRCCPFLIFFAVLNWLQSCSLVVPTVKRFLRASSIIRKMPSLYWRKLIIESEAWGSKWAVSGSCRDGLAWQRRGTENESHAAWALDWRGYWDPVLGKGIIQISTFMFFPNCWDIGNWNFAAPDLDSRHNHHEITGSSKVRGSF